ncbi:MAG: hypothetical protein AB1642_06325 [Pseudomonadota bacterium]
MARPIYYVSARPEAYEQWGEVSVSEAKLIALTIVRQAAVRFPHVEFRVCDGWSVHEKGMNQIATYIDKHWERWVAGGRERAA